MSAPKPPPLGRLLRQALKAAEYCEAKPPPGPLAPVAALPVVPGEVPVVPAVPLGLKPRPAPRKAVAALAGTPWLSRHEVNLALLAEPAPAALGAVVLADVVGAAVFVDPPPHAPTMRPEVAIASASTAEWLAGVQRRASAGLRTGLESILR